MTAIVDGIQVEGTPEEIHRFLNLKSQKLQRVARWQESIEKIMKKPPEPIPALATLNSNVT